MVRSRARSSQAACLITILATSASLWKYSFQRRINGKSKDGAVYVDEQGGPREVVTRKGLRQLPSRVTVPEMGMPRVLVGWRVSQGKSDGGRGGECVRGEGCPNSASRSSFSVHLGMAGQKAFETARTAHCSEIEPTLPRLYTGWSKNDTYGMACSACC